MTKKGLCEKYKKNPKAFIVQFCICAFIHMAVPFAVDWSPSAWCEGPPRLAHALSAAAASALQPRAYAGETQTEGEEEVVMLKDVI